MDPDRILAALGQGKNVLNSWRASYKMEASIRDQLREDIPLTPEQEQYIEAVEAS